MDIHNPYLLSGHIQLIISCPDLSLPKGVNSFILVISCTRLKENAKDAKDAKGAIEIFASFASFALFFNGFAIEIVLNAKDAKGAISLKISVNQDNQHHQCSIQNFKLNKFFQHSHEKKGCRMG